MSSPKISVVLPTYNRRHVLPRGIASVLAQQEQDFELLIVDDFSTDDTQEYLASLTDPRIRAMRPPQNLGTAGARNFGLDAARGDVVAFLDSDDAFLPNRLTATLAVFARDPEVVATLSSSVRNNLKGEEIAQLPELTLPSKAFEWALFSDLIPVEGTGITVRRDIATRLGGFCRTVKCLEDREFLVRAARVGKGALIAEPLWEKFWSKDGVSNQRDQAGNQFLSYVAVRPEFTGKFRRLGSYFATKIIVSDMRRGFFRALGRDLYGFAKAGLIDANLVRMWRYHREVHNYRRTMSNAQALASLSGPPAEWA